MSYPRPYFIIMEKYEKAIKKWEKDFEHKMSSNERTMFIWGYTSAVNTLSRSTE